MSEFSRFMKANKKVKANQKYAPTASLTDTDGKPLCNLLEYLTQ